MIPLSAPSYGEREARAVADALNAGRLEGGGVFTRACEARIEAMTGATRVLLTPSCTAALEMAALLSGVGEGDEVIMPSFTFVSTANAFALRGATPVFVDVDPATLNIDPDAVERAITPRTRVIAPVHYAGVGCDMDELQRIAGAHGLTIIEDAAQAIGATWRGRPLGSLGAMGAISFHQTKNLSCGEGGALLINDGSLVERAEIIREKGTDRSRFLRGEINKYEWQSLGSSFLTNEMTAALLSVQLDREAEINGRRLRLWARYDEAFAGDNRFGKPHVPNGATHNAHIFYLIAASPDERQRMLVHLRAQGIGAASHYVPLHDTPAGRLYGRAASPLPVTENLSFRLIRLPLSAEMTDVEQDRIIAACRAL